MARLRVYIKTFDENMEYVSDYVEVTDDVDFDSLGDMRQNLDDDAFNVGVFKYNEWNLVLRNEHGLYSNVGTLSTMFRWKRADSLVKLVWEEQNFDSLCGVVRCGQVITSNTPVQIFEGLLVDDAFETEIKEQQARFKVIGKEMLFSRTETPFGSLSNGDLASEVLYTILNQSPITDLLTVDLANLTPALDVAVDDISDWENTTVREVLNDVLMYANAVLYIRDNTIYVQSRDPSASIEATFYGQASNNGIENIIDISKIVSGVSNSFNLWTWEDTTLAARELTSIDDWGARKKEVNFTPITNNTTRQNILNELRDAFGAPKMQLNITVPATREFLQLGLLDRVNIDYPTVFFPVDNEPFAIYGVSRYGEARYPFGVYSLTLNTSQEFKILGRTVKNKAQLIEFRLREV